MSLPKINSHSAYVTSTSLSGPMTKPNYEVYPPRLPSAPEIPARVNPLQPPPPKQRTFMLETIEPHWHNDTRTARMKQREHFRYHNTWGKYYYGSPAERESHRQYTRTVLKQQMVDKWQSQRQSFQSRVAESEQAVRQDMQCRVDDARSFQDKHMYLKTFRDDNKSLMEKGWATQRRQKSEVDKFDREQLRYNPINWSCSLK